VRREVFSVNGDEVVPAGPQRLYPVFEATPERHGIDAVHQCAQPPFARDSMMERREPAKKAEMVLAPADDIVEVIARADRGASQQKQDLGQRIGDPPPLAVVLQPRKVPQKQRHAGARNFLVGAKLGCRLHGRPHANRPPRESHPAVKIN